MNWVNYKSTTQECIELSELLFVGLGFQPRQYKNKGFKLHCSDEYSCVISCPELSFKRFVYSNGYTYERIMMKSCAKTFEHAEKFVFETNEKNSYFIIERKVGSRWIKVMSN